MHALSEGSLLTFTLEAKIARSQVTCFKHEAHKALKFHLLMGETKA